MVTSKEGIIKINVEIDSQGVKKTHWFPQPTKVPKILNITFVIKMNGVPVSRGEKNEKKPKPL